MKTETGVIFLVGNQMYKNNFLSVLLEKSTQYKVFSFFSVEESLLYQRLNPSLVIHDEDSYYNSERSQYINTNQTYFSDKVLNSGEYAKVIPQVFNELGATVINRAS